MPGGSNSTNLNVTVDSNAPYKVMTRALGNFTDGAKTFPVSNMKFNSIPYSTNDQEMITGTAPGGNHLIVHTLTVPSDAQAGSYSVGITLTAIQT